MGDIPKYLDEYQKLCMQQLSYLSQRMTQREMLDKEIADLYEKAKSDYQYVHAILEKAELKPKIMQNPARTVVPQRTREPIRPAPSSKWHRTGKSYISLILWPRPHRPPASCQTTSLLQPAPNLTLETAPTGSSWRTTSLPVSMMVLCPVLT